MMKAFMRMALMALIAVLLSACASVRNGSYVTLLASPDGSVGKVVVTGVHGEHLIDQAHFAAPLDGSAPAAPVDEAKFQRDFGAVMAARPALPKHFVLYFESGGAQLTAESSALLAGIIEEASRRPTVDMSVIGHSDTVGTAEVNDALSLKRAQAVADMLLRQGLRVDALTVESHGKRNLLIPTPDETPEPRNRRVEVSIR